MERRKRVEAIMESKLFREELERIVDSQIKEGGASGILQQLSDIVGVPASRVGSVFKSSNCVVPINDIRGIESMGYDKGEKILRCKLAATFRLLDLYGWTQGLGAQITARLNADQELFLVNPYGLLFHEVTASSLNKVDMQGQVVEQGTTNFGINKNRKFVFLWLQQQNILMFFFHRISTPCCGSCCPPRHTMCHLFRMQFSCRCFVSQMWCSSIDQRCSSSR